jgi:peptidoglycan/xylan/chitin deacetylase (PgdA/CDA1 family)
MSLRWARPVLRWASPSGEGALLSILIFHRVLTQPDALMPDEVHAARFEALCRWLREGFNVLPLAEALRRRREGTLPDRAVCITFDDGYADNHDVALPLLQRHGLHATFFISTGYLDGGMMWNDRLIEAVRRTPQAALAVADLLGPKVAPSLPMGSLGERQAACRQLLSAVKYLPRAERGAIAERIVERAGVRIDGALMMTGAQVRAMDQAGMGLGGHTVSHPILASLDEADARAEIEGGKHALEGLLDRPVTLFAYPNGRPGQDYGPTAVRLVREAGFEAAVSTAWGASRTTDDPLQLPRFTPWDATSWRFALRMARTQVSSRATPAVRVAAAAPAVADPVSPAA